jgi:hypothetical protein
MRNPDKAAIDYLITSGASCVCVLADGTIRAGSKPDRSAVSIWWLPEAKAIAVSRQARRDVGETRDVAAIEAALPQAAADHGVCLTAHHIAIERVAAAAQVSAIMDSMKGTGRLKVFNHHYKVAGAAALARGSGFMSYGVALGRLRVQIGRRLAAGSDVYAPGMLTEVFRSS